MRRANSTFVIAEAGVNHNGSVSLAKELIDAAKAAGADAVKFQTFNTKRLASRCAVKADYQRRTTDPDERQFEMLKRLELNEKAHFQLVDFCARKKIAFLSSAFDLDSADLLERTGMEIYKIPSGEITNVPLLRHIAEKQKEIILSTGMCTLGEVEEALDTIQLSGNSRVRLLHCVTEYPAPVESVNLRAMVTLRNAFHLPVGYSDHTKGFEIAIAAVALGAEIIEKHLTLAKTMKGPDHEASLDPEEFKNMVNAIRNVESSLGDGVKRPAACEVKNIPIARKSAVASRTIKRGEKITANKVTLKRPGYGIQPKDLEKVYGLRATSVIQPDEVLTWDKVN